MLPTLYLIGNRTTAAVRPAEVPRRALERRHDRVPDETNRVTGFTKTRHEIRVTID